MDPLTEGLRTDRPHDERPPPRVQGSFFDDLSVGAAFRTGARTITETDLVNFVGHLGFIEPLFLDAGHAPDAGFSGRLVPGALTFCLAEGLLFQTNVLSGTAVAFLGMELDVHRPVFVGDTIDADVIVTELRPTSDGRRGIVTTRNEVRNGAGDLVLTYHPRRMVLRRSAAEPTEV